MIVVSDTSPLSALLTIGKTGILTDLFGVVIVPPAVWSELSRYHDALSDYMFLKVQPLADRHGLEEMKRVLDEGEAEAILLAKEIHAEYLLIDETLGRNVAKLENVPFIGLMGVLLMAKEKGLIPALAPLLEDIEQNAGFFLSRKVKRQVLEAAGEAEPH